MAYKSFVLLFVWAAVLLQKGDALRCWSCSSDMDAPCADYFNTTRFTRYYNSYSGPQVMLQNCDDNRSTYGTAFTQKAVCMKKKQTTYGKTTFVRQCRYLHHEEKVGECPPETTSSATTIDFCEYCDYDGCNTAGTLSQTVILSIFVPLVLMLFVRK